jgi:peptidoglycan/xylan/chitin deacetylase (PgdA/CDA1 family)
MSDREGTWGEHQAAAAFTFDLDAESVWTAEIESDPRFDTPSIRTRGGFGPEVAVPRILDVLERHDVRATFFVPGVVVEEHPEVVGSIADAGHELGHHGYTHRSPTELSRKEEVEEIQRGLTAHEDVLGQRPVGYRSPAADLGEHTLQLLAEYDFAYESSLLDDDRPYVHDLASGRTLVELPFAWHLDDWPYFGYNMWPPVGRGTIAPTADVFDSWTREFRGLYRRERCFVLTMHPQLIGRAGRIDAFEELLQEVRATGDTWIATGKEIADVWRNRRE